MKEVFTVQNAEQARLLQDLAYLHMIGHLLKAEASAAELARASGQTVQATHHKLKRLVQAGLLEVRRIQSRGGRPVKVYGVLAQEFRVPFALTTSATLGELVHEAHRPLLEAHYQTTSEVQREGGDLRIWCNERGRMEITLNEVEAKRNPTEAVHSVFLGYHLSPANVQELTERLETLADWLSEQSLNRDQDGADYLLGLLLAPAKTSRP